MLSLPACIASTATGPTPGGDETWPPMGRPVGGTRCYVAPDVGCPLTPEPPEVVVGDHRGKDQRAAVKDLRPLARAFELGEFALRRRIPALGAFALVHRLVPLIEYVIEHRRPDPVCHAIG